MAKWIGFNYILFAILYLCVTPACFAQEAYLNEVFRTELVYPQEKGEMQISFLPAFLKQRDEKNFMFPIEIEYGLTDAWQISLLTDGWIMHYPNQGAKESGMGDFGIGSKYSWLHIQNSDYSLAVNFEMMFPTANINKGLTEGFRTYEPSLLFAEDFPNFHQGQLFTQIGFEFLQRIKTAHTQTDDNLELNSAENNPLAHSFFINVGYFVPVGMTRYTVELNWENNEWNHHGNENNLYFTPGIVWDPSKHWEFGLGSSIGLTKQSDPYDIFLHIIYEFDVLANDKYLI